MKKCSETKVMQSSGVVKANLRVDGANLEEIDSYDYLGREVSMRHNLQPEIAL